MTAFQPATSCDAVTAMGCPLPGQALRMRLGHIQRSPALAAYLPMCRPLPELALLATTPGLSISVALVASP